MALDSILDYLHDLFSGDTTLSNADFDADNIGDILAQYGVDLSSYSPDEISQALEHAFHGGNDADFNTDSDSYSPQSHTNISFGANLSSLEAELRQAINDIDYYERELRRTNISNTYRSNCTFKLQQAIKKAAELKAEISNLKK